MQYILLLAILIGLLSLIYRRKTNKWKAPKYNFPTEWRVMLNKYIAFYRSLDADDKRHFEFKIQEFLYNIKITGIKTKVEDLDRLMIASSAIIPIFSFKDWQYLNLTEVLLYPESFDKKFQFEDKNGRILGMVGSGYMEGKMILSKKALKHGFIVETDKSNTAIHEFAHLIDKADGTIDGIPELLMDKQFAIPWYDLMMKKTFQILDNKSDINPYATTNEAEFFAVLSEYFFERPQLLERNHPQLYASLKSFFKQDMIHRKSIWRKTKKDIQRNDPCPCGSGQKYKRCCGGSI